MKITLIGLGVGKDDLTIKAKKALDGATKILARTANTTSFASLQGYNVQTLDELFERSRNFDTLNQKLAKAVLQAAKESDVCYCVDGAVAEDKACQLILAKQKNVEICEGVSKTAHATSLARLKATHVVGISVYDLDELKSNAATVVYDIDSAYTASLVKEKLSQYFGEETACHFVHGEEVKTIAIYELDRQKNYDYACAVAVEAQPFLKRARYDYADLEHIIRLLREPNGCPWDRVQTPATIRKNIIEEAYELVDAIERDDEDAMREETGDLLLQAAFVSVMEEEKSAFTGMDVTSEVVSKLIFRHSHIFGSDKATDAQSALGVWEKNKNIEKKQTTYGEQVAAVPKNFPACMRAQKVQKRAAKSGMDFISPISAGERMDEELKELIDALVANDQANVEEEAGDLLFSAVNVCRLAGVDCEQALAGAIDKFARRFIKTEELVLADGKKMNDLTELDLDWYWLQAKRVLHEDSGK
jgi:tetrapyrrole methylase family protein/MazG family protein